MKTGFDAEKLMFLSLVLWSCPALGADEVDRKIAAADTIIVEVFGEKDFSVERRVEAGGTIVYPFLGNVEVAGKTTLQVVTELKEKLEKDYLVTAQVSVNVKEYTRWTVAVLGEVAGRVGPIKLPGEKQMDIVEAIAEAGGFTSNANKNKIQLTRNGQTTTYKFDELRKVSDPRKKVWLEPGDIVYVPERIF
ncbi:MAG: polysaccharide export protein [Verrucomicrobia bacterium]|nr:polysaccharide export protein [Verrucomicrobiota bacterium]